MSSGLVRCALHAVLEERELQVNSSRMETAKALGRNILEKATSGEAEMTAFDVLSVELTTCLRSIFQHDSAYRSSAARREKFWIAFHQLRLSEIPKIWDRFLSSQQMQSDKLLQQSVSQKLFEMLLRSQFSTTTASQRRSSQHSHDAPLSKDELNVLQYACGYVPHALLRRYQKRSGQKYEKYIECLGEMAVRSEHENVDFLAYTREWMDKVNRGGLFPLNDATYQFFISIEKEVRVLLPTYMAKSADSQEAFKELVIEQIAQSEDVQWNWTLISQCIDVEKDAIELLRDIITLWVTVRGFSITATWMEVYKKEAKLTTKKKPGLRKGLGQSST